MTGSNEQPAGRRVRHSPTVMPSSLQSVPKRFNNLPAPVTSLIGRESECQAVYELLTRPEIRLVTMTGTGGIGKTRLALTCAGAVLPYFEDGAGFVSLASVTNPDFVLSELIQTLGIKEQSDFPALTSLKQALRNKHLLLVLDSFEHLIDAAPLLLDLLQGCPNLTMLVTSREVLHVPGEWIFLVPPLAVPELKQATASDLATNASLALFIERAQARKPDFQITARNASVLIKICRQLDGLPLALELAAPRVNLLTLQQLLMRLTRRLDILSQPGNAVPERQQTMRRTIQWSYDLLNAQEQQLFCRLSVFVEGYSLSDIEALYTRLEDDPAWVLEGVSSLLDKNLLVQGQQDEPETRLNQLETIREFGQEMLTASGQRESMRAAHAEYYASLVPEPAPTQLALAEGAWLEFLKRAYPNLLAALHFFEEKLNMAQALQLAIGIGGIWSVNGYISEGQEELEQALALCQQRQLAIPPFLHCVAFTLAGRIASYNTDILRTRHWYQKALQTGQTAENNPFLPLAFAGLALVESELGNYAEYDALYYEWIPKLRQSGNKGVLARLLSVAPLIWLHRGMLEQAQADTEESVQILRAMGGQQWALAVVLHASGWIAYVQGLWDSAQAAGQESVTIFRQLGMPAFAVEALCTFAYETAAAGELEIARALFQEALSLSQNTEDARESARALCGLGYLALRRAELAQARPLFEESLQMIQQVKQLSTRFTHIPASSLEGLAFIASAEQQFTYTTRLLGAADALRQRGPYIDPLGREAPFWEQARQAAAQALRENTFSAAFTEGQHLTPSQALVAQEPGKHAQKHLRPSSVVLPQMLGQITSEKTLPATHLPSGEHLTRREIDVLCLLAQGLTNAKIAEKLVLSVVTVNSYLRSVYGKLGVSSRTAAMRYALDHHLI